MHECRFLGIPTDSGTARNGCRFGPAAYRRAGIDRTLRALGHRVTDLGDVTPEARTFVTPEASILNTPGTAGAFAPAAGARPADMPPALPRLAEVASWLRAIAPAAGRAGADGAVPVFLGGDHSLSAATVPAMAGRAAAAGRPLFVLWLDAHADLHDLASTESGNLHGTPVAYFTGQGQFDGYPPLAHRVPVGNVLQVGLRSVDPAERRRIANLDMPAIDMRAIDEYGLARPIADFLARVREAGGDLHVSLDVDFLDPAIAPAVGTKVPGGASYREAHLIMELVHDSGCLTSLDLVELDPTLDEDARTVTLMIDLAASLFGRRILDRKTGS